MGIGEDEGRGHLLSQPPLVFPAVVCSFLIIIQLYHIIIVDINLLYAFFSVGWLL
jgi:hypothetical protein